MKLYKVIENDIDVKDIWQKAQMIGFEEFEIFITPLIGQKVSLKDYNSFPKKQSIKEDFINATKWRSLNFPIFFIHKDGSSPKDSRRMEGLKGEISLDNITTQDHKSEVTQIELIVTNSGSSQWLPSGNTKGSVNIGILITDSSETKQHRTHLSNEGVQPGQELKLLSNLPRLRPGSYAIEIDLVAEHVCWFSAIGGEKTTLEINVD
jgi:hypothetical protein